MFGIGKNQIVAMLLTSALHGLSCNPSFAAVIDGRVRAGGGPVRVHRHSVGRKCGRTHAASPDENRRRWNL